MLAADSPTKIEGSIWNRGLKAPSGKGKRLIINYLGSSNGFLEDCGKCFARKKITSDYRHEMNACHFEE